MKKTLLAASVIIPLLALGTYLLLAYTPVGFFVFLFLNKNPGRFDRAQMEAIVAEVRIQPLKPDEEKQFKLDDHLDPKSLRPLKPGEVLQRGENVGHVRAVMSAHGKLKVVIQTRDLGHAGSFGFAYSNVPLTPEHDMGDWYLLDAPGPLDEVQPSMKIDLNWWKVESID